MSNSKEGDNRGASITPSARPSIHSNRNYPPSGVPIMVRYGLDKKKKPKTRPSPEGVDEIDNVVSKFLYTSDMQPKFGQKRRNSIDIPSQPEIHSSEDNDSDSEGDTQNAPGQWQNISHISNSSGGSFTNRSINKSSKFQCESSDSIDRSTHNVDNENKTSPVTVISVIVIALAIMYPLCKSIFKTPENHNGVYYDEKRYYKEINDLKTKYRVSDDSILRVKSGISAVSERNDTSSFIFTYDSQSDNFNNHLFNKFIHEIAYTTANYLRNDSTSVNYLSLEGSKLNVKTHGELVTKYRDEVTKTGVMLVKEIDKVPSTLAMGFHYYCDEYDPLARKSAIFFTLNMAQCYTNAVQKSTHSNIEKCLAKKWNAVPQDNIGPLLTRVVNVIVDVTDIS